MTEEEYIHERLQLIKDFHAAAESQVEKGRRCHDCSKYYLATGENDLAFRGTNIFYCKKTCYVDYFRRKSRELNMETQTKYEVPEKNKKEKERLMAEYEKAKSENQVLQVDVDILPAGEKCAYLAGYIDGMKYILEGKKPEKTESLTYKGSPWIVATDCGK